MQTPPFLLGVTLLFWGWQTDLLLFAAVMAAILEGARLVPFRWDFTPAEFNRMADTCTVMLLGMLFYLLMSQSLTDILFSLIQWLPFVFFPLLAGQCYSTRRQLDLRALFLALRKQPGHFQTSAFTVNLTYPYVMLCLLAAGAANLRIQWFYPGLCLLSAWALWARRSPRYAAPVWAGLLLMAGLIGYGGQRELSRLQSSLEQNPTLLRWFTGLQDDPDPYQSVTAIGDVGSVKLSNRVIFRVKAASGPQPPLLFRETSYDTYQASKWHAAQAAFTNLAPEQDGVTWKRQPTPAPLASMGFSDDVSPKATNSPPGRGRGGLPGVRQALNGKNPPLPLPGGEFGSSAAKNPYLSAPTPPPSTSLRQAQATALDGQIGRVTVALALPNGKGMLKLPTGTFEIGRLPVGILAANQFGAVKVAEGPARVTYQAIFRPDNMLDSLPSERDLVIPPAEMPALRSLAAELALTSTAPDAILPKIQAFFQTHFTYSLTLSRQTREITALADFLRNVRAGHCEYFATATVLLLRAAGIPARYAVGYAVDRLDQEEAWTLVRGRDAHAWTLVYLNGGWHDFDTTPASWRQIEEQAASPFEFISDLWSRGLFALAEWRERQGGLGKSLGWLLIPLVLALAWKLRAKKRLKPAQPNAAPDIESRCMPGADSDFYLIEQRLQAAGFARESWEPLSHWLQRVTEQAAPAVQTLQLMLLLHYRYRFDPAGIAPAEKAALQAQVQAWLAQAETELAELSDFREPQR